MTRIPTATRRQRVEVRASQTGPELPRLHARPRPWPAAVHGWYCQIVPGSVIAHRPERVPFHRQAEGFPPGPGRPGFHPRRNPMRLGLGGMRIVVAGSAAILLAACGSPSSTSPTPAPTANAPVATPTTSAPAATPTTSAPVAAR